MNSLNHGLCLTFHHPISRAWGTAWNMVCVECISEEANRSWHLWLLYHRGLGRELQGLRVARPSPPGAGGGRSPNLSPIAHPIAAAEATQETVESLMQKFKESFRANTPIAIGQLQPAPRRASAGKRKRRSKSRGRPSQHHLPGRQWAAPRFRRYQEEPCPLPLAALCSWNGAAVALISHLS